MEHAQQIWQPTLNTTEAHPPAICMRLRQTAGVQYRLQNPRLHLPTRHEHARSHLTRNAEPHPTQAAASCLAMSPKLCRNTAFSREKALGNEKHSCTPNCTVLRTNNLKVMRPHGPGSPPLQGGEVLNPGLLPQGGERAPQGVVCDQGPQGPGCCTHPAPGACSPPLRFPCSPWARGTLAPGASS